MVEILISRPVSIRRYVSALPFKIMKHHPLPLPFSNKSPISSATKSAAAKFSINSVLKRCRQCGGKGAIDCPGCKGTGKNKSNGNIFERWKCYECQGFGLKSCPGCGKGGLTPEQRGER